MKVRTTAAMAALTLAVGLSACGSSSSSSSGGSGGGGASGGTVKIGASLTMTGTLSVFGAEQKAGYEYYVSQMNSQGGVTIGGKKYKLQLTILDNRSDPSTGAQQTSTLILQHGVQALVGPCAPNYVIPQALIADRQRIPYVDTCSPQEAFLSGNPSGWTYSWEDFFDEHQQAANMVANAAAAPSNKKLALFTDTEPDGQIERPLYKAQIAAHGLKLAGDFTFPPGTTDFSSFINSAKTAGAQLVIAQMVPPDAIAMVKQMKSLGFKPKVLDISKGADIDNWLQVMGPLGNGTTLDQEYVPNRDAQASAFTKVMLAKLKAEPAVNGAATGYSAMQIVIGAMEKAGSTDPQKVNAAMGSLNMTTIYGPVSFGSNHVNKTPVPFGIVQYQNGKLVFVHPSVDGGKLITPMAGLQ
jgi:branched-chain amino acid transport system substrate-binding protein